MQPLGIKQQFQALPHDQRRPRIQASHKVHPIEQGEMGDRPMAQVLHSLDLGLDRQRLNVRGSMVGMVDLLWT